MSGPDRFSVKSASAASSAPVAPHAPSAPAAPSAVRRIGRAAALTAVFSCVLATGAATGALPGEGDKAPARQDTAVAPHPGKASGTAHGRVSDEAAEAASEAMSDGKSPEQSAEAAEEAVSRSGDRWGAVYSQGEYHEFEQALDGEYTGVGLWARRTADGQVQVTKVRSGSPAALAGIRDGDRIAAVNGRAVTGRPVTEVLTLLRGERAGTSVHVGLQRGTRAWSETLRRANLPTDSVSVSRVGGGATLVKVTAFTKGSGEKVRTAVRAAPARGGVVLDLRGNSGGLIDEAVTAASAFLDGGLVATYDVRGSQRALHARGGGDTTRPLVVLVDSGTMSAAELLTGALQDRGRAVVVGTRTFGKGSVQMPSRLPDGSVAELTVGHYRTPSGRGVDSRGITPDLEADKDALRRAETVLTGLGTPS
ncbi:MULTISPECIES: S41 family peptidase [unclassified Streptomyces]|uniref:S41 family peptidase n=1 Tax=unclassified Streptomyces TaxID=2593676 RepID=UPI000DB98009|nr:MULTISPECIES: S41 family peptidase [unclassified Streptomyces]MYT71260.1 PDZ domain-containing protein [Streptomyces sp. SID8367]